MNEFACFVCAGQMKWIKSKREIFLTGTDNSNGCFQFDCSHLSRQITVTNETHKITSEREYVSVY